METEYDSKLSFLDVVITSSDNSFLTSVHRKSTFTGLFLNFTSFTPLNYKIGLIKTLIDRSFKICHNWMCFSHEFITIKKLLAKNAYPIGIIDRVFNTYVKKTLEVPVDTENEENISYMKLPYIGKFSKFTQNKVNRLCDRFCNKTKVQVVFSPTKISSFLSTKDGVPSVLKSYVVYKFICANCQVSYVGETCRHLHVRINEHFKSPSSHIFKHLSENSACKQSCDNSCFQVIDSDFTSFRLKIKEAMHIGWVKPSLNQQVRHLAVSISV